MVVGTSNVLVHVTGTDFGGNTVTLSQNSTILAENIPVDHSGGLSGTFISTFTAPQSWPIGTITIVATDDDHYAANAPFYVYIIT